jgi:hypothetical protein
VARPWKKSVGVVVVKWTIAGLMYAAPEDGMYCRRLVSLSLDVTGI